MCQHLLFDLRRQHRFQRPCFHGTRTHCINPYIRSEIHRQISRHVIQGRFGGSIGTHIRASVNTPHGSNIHDRTVSSLLHVRNSQLAQPPGTKHVYFKNMFEILHCHPERILLSSDTHVIHQNIQFSEFHDRALHQIHQIGILRHVAFQRQRLTPHSPYVFRHLLGIR